LSEVKLVRLLPQGHNAPQYNEFKQIREIIKNRNGSVGVHSGIIAPLDTEQQPLSSIQQRNSAGSGSSKIYA
jgi:hypothetical protein